MGENLTDVLATAEVEEIVREDYDFFLGKVLLLNEVECYNEDQRSETASCFPPAIGRIVPHNSERAISDFVSRRWMDDLNIDPAYDVEILEPHPAFSDLRPSWVYGPTRSTTGLLDKATGDFVVAPPELQEKYRDIVGLDQRVVGSCAPGHPEQRRKQPRLACPEGGSFLLTVAFVGWDRPQDTLCLPMTSKAMGTDRINDISPAVAALKREFSWEGAPAWRLLGVSLEEGMPDPGFPRVSGGAAAIARYVRSQELFALLGEAGAIEAGETRPSNLPWESITRAYEGLLADRVEASKSPVPGC